MKSFFDEYQCTLDIIEWPVLQYAGVEADDVAAHLVKNKDEFGFETMWLISSDRGLGSAYTGGCKQVLLCK